MNAQKPVPPEVFEELKMFALLGESCTLQFRAANGGMAAIETRIKDVFEDEDGQFLLAADGFTLLLHQLISINGKPLAHFC